MLKTAQLATLPVDRVLEALKSHAEGLTHSEVSERHRQYGLNTLHTKKISIFAMVWRQVRENPLIIILAVATTISYLLGQHASSYYIFWMIFISITLGFWNEFFAQRTIDALMKKVSLNAVVLRNGEKKEVPTSQVTIGDIVLLAPGSIVPADLRIIDAKHLTINESALTGESIAVTKSAHPSKEHSQSTTLAFMGTVVESGWAKGVANLIGTQTKFGQISESVSFVKPETSFQEGLTRFGNLLVRVVIILTIIMFIINTLLKHPLLDSILFALAIAVGLTPELLPVIVTISLSHGARKLLKKEVLVKQLVAIENLGNMDILCTDKTGTLTEGKVTLVNILNTKGEAAPELLVAALHCNTAIVHHKIIGDPIDTALWEYASHHHIQINHHSTKVYEEPLDFDKRAMYSVIETDGKRLLIAKGAPEAIIGMSNKSHKHRSLMKEFDSLSQEGYRVIAIGTKSVKKAESYSWNDVKGITFQGYLTFSDVPKKSAIKALEKLKSLNVSVKVITGDSEHVARKICSEVGIDAQEIITGEHLATLTPQKIRALVNDVSVFARVSPEQKLLLVKTLQQNGHTVGYMGDGINDAPSLYTADVGISVNGAVDVAKNAASVVLMQKSLEVITEGIIQGRMIFNNTIKYILMGTSSNFGNMFSAAGASFLLPFLPMQPLQILLNNSLYDISQMTIPSDNVDPESLIKPRHWNIDFIKHYMIFFGPISSLYDFLTFGIMYFIFHARDSLFQTGWFIESLATQVLVVFIIRTGRPFFKSRPGIYLTLTCLAIIGIAFILPFTPLASAFGFTPLPLTYFAVLILLVSTYLIVVEISKRYFLRRYTL